MELGTSGKESSMDYDNLRIKWGKSAEQGKAGYCFDSKRLASGVFCLHLADCGGESMSSLSQVEVTGYFDSALDVLGYLRFAEIPKILAWDSATDRESTPEVADAYLLKYEADQRAKIDHLLGLLDRSLLAGAVSSQELSLIRSEFNASFSDTNPEIQILAWGTLRETLTDNYFTEVFENDISDEEGKDDRPSATLKELLDSGDFDENNDKHLSMAKEFLEMHMSA